jgi:hypothetical protein
MAYKGDIITKYQNAYKEFESQSKNRLNDLKRSFSDEKKKYEERIEKSNENLNQQQNDFFTQVNQTYQAHLNTEYRLKDEYLDTRHAFNENINTQMQALDQKIKDENELYEAVLEDYENKKQHAMEIYLSMVKENNDAIDKDMQVHHEFIEEENNKLIAFKKEYDETSAKLSNKMIWAIEKSKNAIEGLQNQLENVDKDDLISLNQKIIHSLTNLRGTRNDINALYKDTANQLSQYREYVFDLRQKKQKPHTDINQELIHSFIQKIRQANDSKNIYKSIINNNLDEAKEKLYPLILKANKDDNKDLLEKYILQVETLEYKANFLINKIEKISQYNISTYQKRIKEIKVNAFKRNEEIKFSYTVPVKYIENAINIYSNYNFYFNQGFSDLDKLLSQLIDFSLEFNEVKDEELIHIKKDMADFQNNLLAIISQVSDKLSQLLLNIDEVATEIITLESSHRLEVAEIKKEMVNINIKGDYIKFMETLNHDLDLASHQYDKRIKTINIHKLYKDKLVDFYQRAIDLEFDKKMVKLNQKLNHEMNALESRAHKDYYDHYKSQLDIFFQEQSELLNIMMQMLKERLVQSVKSLNYQWVKNYTDLKESVIDDLSIQEDYLLQYINRNHKSVRHNNNQTRKFTDYLGKQAKKYSTLTYIEKLRLDLVNKLKDTYQMKIKETNQKLIDSYVEKRNKIKDIDQVFDKIQYKQKEKILVVQSSSLSMSTIENEHEYKYILAHIMKLHYDVLSYAYQNQASKNIDKINQFFNQILEEITIESIQIHELLNNKKTLKSINKHLIERHLKIKKANDFYKLMINESHKVSVESWTQQIAKEKITFDNKLSIINQEYDDFVDKILKLENKFHKQAKLVEDITLSFNQWLEKNVENLNIKYRNDKENKEKVLLSLEKKVKATIKKNDLELLGHLKSIDQHMIEQYQLIQDDYFNHLDQINKAKEKIDYDASVENQYIDYSSDNEIERIRTVQEQLRSQLDTLPIEKKQRLLLLESQYKETFNYKYDLLMNELRKIEKDKFTKVPMLEEQISNKESKLEERFNNLYAKHRSLETEYLNQYVHTNDILNNLHGKFVNDSIKNSLGYDQELNQPFRDLLNVQSTIVEKTDIINHEIKHKTKDKIDEIKKDEALSENKQNRIINS